MAWKEVNKVEQREIFISRYLNGEKMANLCREYQISRKTGYKFLKRFEEQGFKGLDDLSRKPKRSPFKTDVFFENIIIDYKGKYPSWGPKKLKTIIEESFPGIKMPATSTIGYILDKHNLVKKRPRRIKRSYYSSGPLRNSFHPNDIWCIDFKGQFKTGDNKYCYPLTVTDHYSRYIIACEALENIQTKNAKPIIEGCFKKFGLPKIIRSDNGSPFATARAIYGLSKLSAWFISIGINIERIEPGHPEQNGRHERMHRTLKEETLRPPGKNILHQQEIFDNFIETFNNIRPHEALNQKTPCSVYLKSTQKYKKNKENNNYKGFDLMRKVDSNGSICLNNKRDIAISTALTGHLLGLRELEKNWLVCFCNFDLGYISKDNWKFESLEFLED